MKRRQFLKLLLSGTAAMGGFLHHRGSFLSLDIAEAASGEILVVIFQRGGCDGLNLCVPFGDDNYYSLRPSLAIGPPGSGGGPAALPLDNFFGFHPEMEGLHRIYHQGNMAVFPAVHYPDASRSHFDSELIIESGSGKKLYSGWLNRCLFLKGESNVPIRAVSFGDSLAHSLSGEASAVVFSDLSSFGFGRGDFQKELRSGLRSVLNVPVEKNRENLSLIHRQGNIMLDNLALTESLQAGGYEPENGAEYPGGNFGRQLMQTARLIKAGLGLEIACIDMGGWDTHSQQAGRQAARLREFSSGLTSFCTDLGSHFQDVLVLTMTEFGRTARENASRGTDHGNASTWLAIGGMVKGGIYGQWPGLRQDQLYLGRYLAYSIDYRNILAEVLNMHLACPQASDVLPGFEPQPVGFL